MGQRINLQVCEVFWLEVTNVHEKSECCYLCFFWDLSIPPAAGLALRWHFTALLYKLLPAGCFPLVQ